MVILHTLGSIRLAETASTSWIRRTWFQLHFNTTKVTNYYVAHKYVITLLKVTVKGKAHPRTGHEGSEVYLYPFINLDAKWGQEVNATPRPLYPRKRDQLPIVQEAGWVPEPVRKSAGNLAFTDIRSRTVQPEASRYINWIFLTPLTACFSNHQISKH
jgi:hypothetical protein